jgi:predicted AlkP superfamily phosphohydrolase/phosphomutase
MTARALIIGLDGMPLTLLRELAHDGVMPRVGELLRGGRAAELLAPVPEVSSTSWATFLTGANPGCHGIYGFTDLRPGGYDVFFPNLCQLRASAFWHAAAEHGLSTLCLNVPGTYPAPRIHGAVVSGFVAPVLERAVQPPRLLESLRRLGYEVEPEIGDPAADAPGFLRRVSQALGARTRTFAHLLANEPWDLAVAVITETDRLQHFLWNHVADPGSELHEAMLGFYRDVDAAVGRLAGHADATTAIYLVSDHGFGPAHCQFHVNAWLRARGWLPALAEAPSLAVIDGQAKVFALDPGRFYLHRKDRFPRGTLSSAQADELAAELVAELTALRWRDGEVGPDADGPLLLAGAYRRDEVYHGPLAQHAPDVVAVPAAGVQLRGAWRSQALTAPDRLTGAHTRGNAVFWASSADAIAGGADIMDMADVLPLVLVGLGVPPGALGRQPLLEQAGQGNPAEAHWRS